MARGGKRAGAGRTKGTTNRKIKRLRSVMREVAIKVGEIVPDAFEGDGVALMVAIYKDPRIPLDMRLDAASKAARFERPTLQAVEHSGRIDSRVEHSDAREHLAHIVNREAAASEPGEDTPTAH